MTKALARSLPYVLSFIVAILLFTLLPSDRKTSQTEDLAPQIGIASSNRSSFAYSNNTYYLLCVVRLELDPGECKKAHVQLTKTRQFTPIIREARIRHNTGEFSQ